MPSIVLSPPADARDLTFPRYWAAWQRGAGYQAVVLRQDGATAGMALVSSAWGAGEARTVTLLSLSVRRPYRRQGLALALLAAAREHAAGLGATRLIGHYSSRVRAAPALETLFPKAGWARPQVYEIRLAGRADWVLAAQADQAGFLAALERRGYGHRPWVNLRADDHARIAAMIAAGQVAAAFLPPTWPEASQSPFSLALTKDDAVVGWIFGEAQSDGRSVLYHTGWVLPCHQRQGWLMGGLIAVCRFQAMTMGPDSMAVYATAAENHAMRAIMERRLRPHTQWIEQRLETFCPLGDDDGCMDGPPRGMPGDIEAPER